MVAASPLRCRTGLLCGAQRLGKAATLVSSRWSFCPQAQAWTRPLSSVWGDLNHDRTSERHWQRLRSHTATVPKVLCGSSTPAAAHATSQGAVAVQLSSVPFLGGGRPSWSGGLALGPLPPRTGCCRHRRIAPTAQYQRRCARRLGRSDPGTLVGFPSPPSFEGPPAAGRRRVFSWVASSRVVKSHLGSPDVVCHCGGTVDRASSCPGFSRSQGSNLPYTSVGLLC